MNCTPQNRRAACYTAAVARRPGQRDPHRADHRRGLPRRADALPGERRSARMAPSLLPRVKARVDLHASYRARGLIQGRGRSMFKGSGEDFDDLKSYQPGDKISDIDWKATARSGEPLIRQFNEERVRHLSIVADTSSSMSATAEIGRASCRESAR